MAPISHWTDQLGQAGASVRWVSTLLEQLGRPSDARLVLIVCDGLGSTNAANIATYEALRSGVATSAALQVPCPWSRGAAAMYHGEDVGVSLTLLSQHQNYRWGPITHAPSLLDGNGGFPRTASDLFEHADLEEAMRECRAQIERAIIWGFDVSFLAAHLDALCPRPELFDVYLSMAIEFELPISLPDPSVDLGFPGRELAAEEGVVVPDWVVAVPPVNDARGAIEETLIDLKPGVTELHVSPAADCSELRAVTDLWAKHVSDAHLVSQDWAFRALLSRSGAELVSFRDLRDAQRSSR